MKSENEKDFNAMLTNRKNMPKIVEITDEKGVKKWGGKTMVVAPPSDYDKYMKQVPKGKIITTNLLRQQIAKDYKTEITCPLTAGIFVNICAWASFQRTNDITPFWRTLKTNGELNEKYPNGVLFQKCKLEEEGFVVESKGKSKIKYFVKDYEKFLLDKFN